jgi:hypothetical protein
MATAPFSIGRSTGRCASTGRELRPGDRRVTALVERDASEGTPEGFERLDYSEEAWDSGARPARSFGFWRGVVPESGGKPRPFIDDDELLALFEQLGDGEEALADPRKRAFRFVLALLLIRKRLLRHEGGRRNSGRSFMLVRSRGPEGWDPASPLIEVIDPDMDESAIVAATEMLGQTMRGEETP